MVLEEKHRGLINNLEKTFSKCRKIYCFYTNLMVLKILFKETFYDYTDSDKTINTTETSRRFFVKKHILWLYKLS